MSKTKRSDNSDS